MLSILFLGGASGYISQLNYILMKKNYCSCEIIYSDIEMNLSNLKKKTSNTLKYLFFMGSEIPI